jgi:lipopolysaccharide/colanic/teichoic acid biosynthesis glycosyltransferase
VGANVLSGWYPRVGKRCVDFIFAVFGLGVLALPMLLIAVFIRLVDGPPVLFRQVRIGQYGQKFDLLKFRSMRSILGHHTHITVKGDVRITWWGKLLRRWKLDELPQLINVLRGDMSFIGPRPDVPGYFDRLTGSEAILLKLRPGITGPASVAFGNEEELLASVEDPVDFNDCFLFPAKVRINLRYASNITLFKDIVWLLATLLPRSFVYRRMVCEGWFNEIPQPVRAVLDKFYAGRRYC